MSTVMPMNLPGVSVGYVTETELTELEKLLNEVSTGPWKAVRKSEFQGENWQIADFGFYERFEEHDTSLITTDGVNASMLDGDAMSDAEFCAKARNVMPRLLAQFRKMQEGIS